MTNAGFTLADERDLRDAFQKQFGETQYSQYYNFTALDAKTLSALLPKHPKLAGFVPYTVLIYQKKGEANSYVGFVKSDAILLSTGIKDKAVMKADPELFFEVSILSGDNALAKKEELQQEFESALEVEGFKVSKERPETGVFSPSCCGERALSALHLLRSIIPEK